MHGVHFYTRNKKRCIGFGDEKTYQFVRWNRFSTAKHNHSLCLRSTHPHLFQSTPCNEKANQKNEFENPDAMAFSPCGW